MPPSKDGGCEDADAATGRAGAQASLATSRAGRVYAVSKLGARVLQDL